MRGERPQLRQDWSEAWSDDQRGPQEADIPQPPQLARAGGHQPRECRRGCSDLTRSHLQTVDAGFNEIHGAGPQLAKMKDPIKSTVQRISQLLDYVPLPVIKVNI